LQRIRVRTLPRQLATQCIGTLGQAWQVTAAVLVWLLTLRACTNTAKTLRRDESVARAASLLQPPCASAVRRVRRTLLVPRPLSGRSPSAGASGVGSLPFAGS